MKSALGTFFEQQRKAKAITLGQLPAMVGYRNGNKARRLWADLIGTGRCTTQFLRKVATAFGISAEVVQRLIDEDIAENLRAWEEWASQPVKPHLVIRIIAAVYCHGAIPEGLSLEQAEAVASAKAREKGFRVCLVWSRRLSVYFDKNGEVEGRIKSTPDFDGTPYMSLKGRKFLLGEGPK